jgi:glutamate---cysteine ligase / carboxylate-amine ligase
MTDEVLEFKRSEPCTMGVELELQILNARDYNLARDAADLISVLEKTEHPGMVKPEITESMVEINTGIHRRYATLVAELRRIRDAVSDAAERINVCISGGGSHPFHQWGDRRIYPTERFKQLLETYGYLAKQFTIFGQHVHAGVPSGADALYLTHIFARYTPHFIALSASSPFQQGQDTSYQSSRLNTVSAFPLSGHVPFVHRWDDFMQYFNRLHRLKVVGSMKDFYWDVRPKPEFGTVEVRVFDTPLTVERAAVLAAYVQALAHHVLSERSLEPLREVYAFYNYNRFQACRYGLQAEIVDAYREARVSLKTDILDTLRAVRASAAALGSGEVLDALADDVEAERTDAAWLRDAYREHGSLNDVARLQSRLWMNTEKEKV